MPPTIKKDLPMAGSNIKKVLDGWMGGWMDGWEDVC